MHIHLYFVLSFLLIIIPFSQNQAQNRQRFDGGMMVHTGYLHGDLSALNHIAEGMTFGLGGVLRYHLGNHFRLGGEGYVSTLKQMHNGSYIRISWGGLLADAYYSGDGSLMRVLLSVEEKPLRC